MRVLPINNNILNKTNNKSASFKMGVHVSSDAVSAIDYIYRDKFRMVMKRVESVVKNSKPYPNEGGTLFVDKFEELNLIHDGGPYSSPRLKPEHMRVKPKKYGNNYEQLSLKLGCGKCGFYFDGTKSEDTIFNDIMHAISCIKADYGHPLW